MKIPSLILGFVCLVAISNAQEPAPAVNWANKFFVGNSDKVPESVVHDFGTVAKGQVVTHRFKINNIYSIPMQVVEPKPQCGCVSVVQYTNRLDPLEAGFIEVKLDTNKYDGGFKKVTIPVMFVGYHPQTNEKFHSTADVKVQIVSLTEISMNPGSLNFGIVPVGEKLSQSLKLSYNGRAQGWAVTSVAYKQELFDVTVQPENGRFGKTYTVIATLKPGVPPGVLDEEITLNTNDPKAPVIKISVAGKIQASVKMVPEVAQFGAIKLGLTGERKVLVTADKNFSIKEIKGQDEELTAAINPIPPQKTHTINVKLKPSRVGEYKKTLSVVTSTGDVVTLTVTAIGVE